MTALLAFAAGVVIVIVATERLLAGVVGIAAAARVAPFVASAILSGMEAENVAVGLAAGQRGAAEIALGTAYGGALFQLCFALGLGALIAPLVVRVPRGIILLVPAVSVLAGLPALFPETPRWTGIVLLVGFGLAMAYLVRASRGHPFTGGGEFEEAQVRELSSRAAVLWTVVGLAAIAVGGELVAAGGEGLISQTGLGAGLVGMVITPIAIESEEIIRQVVPTRFGHADVAAGNTVGTVVWFLTFNLGLIALLTPVAVPAHVPSLDWPALVVAAVVAAAFLWRGRVGRPQGAVLVALGVAFALAHVLG